MRRALIIACACLCFPSAGCWRTAIVPLLPGRYRPPISPTTLSALERGVSTRKDVLFLLGEPDVSADDTFEYHSAVEEQRAVGFPPMVYYESRWRTTPTLFIQFGAGGVLEEWFFCGGD